MAFKQNGRDFRIDFLRGIALFVVLIDHIESQTGSKLISWLTPISTCFFDGADAFVFMSGLIFGRVSLERLLCRGWLSVQIAALQRAGCIYLTFLATTWIALGIGICFEDYAPLLAIRLRIADNLAACMFWSLSLCYQPYCLEILALYVVVLPLMPLLLLWYMRHPWTASCASCGLYLIALLVPGFCFPRFPLGDEWFFSPMSWQFLYFIGLAIGSTRSKSSIRLVPRGIIFAAALVILILGVLVRCDPLGGQLDESSFAQSTISLANRWCSKTRLGPVRIIHFLTFAYIVSTILPKSDAMLWHTSAIAPAIQCGQHSLAMYSFGTILLYYSIPITHLIGESQAMTLLIVFDICALSLCFSYALEWLHRRRL